MRTPFVLVPESLAGLGAGAAVALDEDRVHHLRRVQRRDDGAALEVTDGNGRVAPAQLVADRVRLTAAPTEVPAPRPAITVVHAVPKGRGLDEIVRTLAELGVAAVHPVLTDHTENRPTGEKASGVGERLRAVSESALEQARSAHRCAVADPTDLAVTLRSLPQPAVRLAADPDGPTTLGAHLDQVGSKAAIQLLIGPEGGLSDRELTMLSESGWAVVRAGSTVLRTVHAGTVLTAALLALTGRFGESTA